MTADKASPIPPDRLQYCRDNLKEAEIANNWDRSGFL